MRYCRILFLFSLFSSFSLSSSQPRLDGIAAVVGDEHILLSEVDAYTALRLKGEGLKPDPDDIVKYRKQYLHELIDGKVLLAHAKNDTTVQVTGEEVDRALDSHIASILQQNKLSLDSLELLLQREQGISLAKFKAESRSAIREQLLKQKVHRQYLSSIKVSRRDVEEFYKTYKDSLPLTGESVLLSKLAIEIAPQASVRQAAYEKILSIKQRLDAGADFAEMAKQHSESPDAASGGDLGFIEKGSLTLLAFEQKAFSLPVGQTSDPFQTQLGFHLVNVVARENQKVHVRQILVSVAASPEQMKKTSALLDSVRLSCRSDSDFAAAVKKYSTDRLSKVRGGRLGWKSLLDLPGQVRGAIDTLQKGGISAVINDTREMVLYRVDDRVAKRRLTLDDDWQLLADKAKDIQAQKKLVELVNRWRRQVYISIKI
ncbi:MAG: peptidylprolyl isomerase [Chitinispirillaceae bacterium]|nr:peptidylprolyl isomerase [Chitinispirillaceae bacterium]